MDVFERRLDCRSACKSIRKAGATIGFIPTMGALHNGHLSLIQTALHHNDFVIASVFVNPNQFNNPNDLNKYPRDESGDLKKLEEIGCSAVLMPNSDEMYPNGTEALKYDFGLLSEVMEGLLRPGHFNGVATVVEKLFQTVTPDDAFFGEKDYQQLCVIRHLVKQKKLGIHIHACPTIREADGLAMSSRNRLLTPEERKAAPFIYQQLCRAKESVHIWSLARVKNEVQEAFAAHPLFQLEYFEIADAHSLQKMNSLNNGNPRGFIAANLGSVRLIDNLAFID